MVQEIPGAWLVCCPNPWNSSKDATVTYWALREVYTTVNKSSLEHTPHVPWRHCYCSSSMALCLVYEVVQYTSSDFMTQWPLPVLISNMHSGTSMHMTLIGVVDRCGWWKCTICSARGLVLSIWTKVELVFWHIWQFDRTYNLRTCLHLEIWRFSCRRRRQTNRLLYPLCMCTG